MSAYSIQAEQSILGACMIDGQAFWQVADLLTTADFWDQRHRALWEAMTSLASRQKPFDVVTISDYLREADKGAAAYVFDIANNTPSSANIRTYAEIVAEKSQERRVCDAGARITKLSGKDSLIDAQAILGSITDTVSGKTKTAKEAMASLTRLLHDQTERESGILGVPYGFPMLDALTAGMQPGGACPCRWTPKHGQVPIRDADRLAFGASRFPSPYHQP